MEKERYQSTVFQSIHWRLTAEKFVVHLRWSPFLWQLVIGCIAVKKKLRARGIQGGTICARCEDPEESINHVFFECLPAVQVWALSRIPSNPKIFSTQPIFTNMDHLFRRIFPELEDHQFAWICISNHLLIQTLDHSRLAVKPMVPAILGRWCFTDGSWKTKEPFSGQGWYSTLKGFDGLMGAKNTRAAQSPLHSEIDALIWALECMRNLRQFTVTFATDYSQLVKLFQNQNNDQPLQIIWKT